MIAKSNSGYRYGPSIVTVFTCLNNKTGKNIKDTTDTNEEGKVFFDDGMDCGVLISDGIKNFLSVAHVASSIAVAR